MKKFDKGKAKALLAEGWTIQEVADDCGVSYSVVNGWVFRNKIPHRKATGFVKPSASCYLVSERKFKELWERGYSVGIIASLYGVTGKNLYMYAVRKGWIKKGHGKRPVMITRLPQSALDLLKREIGSV